MSPRTKKIAMISGAAALVFIVMRMRKKPAALSPQLLQTKAQALRQFSVAKLSGLGSLG